MSLIIKKNTTFKIPRTGSGAPAPTTLPLSTPLLYISGISFTESNPDFRNPAISNPLTRSSNTEWAGSTAGYLLNFGGFWFIYVSCEIYNQEEGAWEQGNRDVCFNASSSTSIPLTGWSNNNEYFTVAGTPIISTTP
jgi:hypothetical protein